MAQKVYGETDRSRGVLTYSVDTTSSKTEVTISAQSTLQLKTYGWSGYRVTTYIDGVQANTKTGYASNNYTDWTDVVETTTATKKISRTHTSQNIKIKSEYKGESAGGYNAGPKSGSTTVTVEIPAKPSYSVTYSANGGSGAPSKQTKWYGENLTLSSTKPTRPGYTFQGWGTSSSDTSVDYKAGASYTSNSAITLYAIWELAYAKPKIQGIDGADLPIVTRSDESGNPLDDGTAVVVSFSWETFSDAYPGVSATVLYKPVSGAVGWKTAATIDLTGTSGTVLNKVVVGPFDTDLSYNVRITVSDSKASSNYETILSTAFFTIDFGAGGKSMGIGCSAPDPTGHPNGLLKVGMDVEFETPHTHSANDITGGEITDTLVVHRLEVKPQSSAHATAIRLTDLDGNNRSGVFSGSDGRLYLANFCEGTDYLERFYLPATAESLDSSVSYNLLTSKGHGIELIWTNASPTSSFGEQTIDLGLSSYSMYIVVARQSTSTSNAISVMQRTGYNAKLCMFHYDGSAKLYQRAIDYSSGSLKFYSAYNNGSASNTVLVPLFIYGIKGVRYL